MEQSPQVRIDGIGRERQPVAVVDSCLADPAALLEAAIAQRYAPLARFYPGVRAPTPSRFYASLFAPLREVLRGTFGFTKGARVRECNFSLVTTPPEQLAPIQRLPHYDGVEPNVVAVLIYLGGVEHGGTSFYRHRRSGFESVTADRFETYRASLADDVRAFGLPRAEYYDADKRFDLIARYEAAFNRALVYRGVTLHSGHILDAATLSSDPSIGRLTINAFLEPADAPRA